MSKVWCGGCDGVIRRLWRLLERVLVGSWCCLVARLWIRGGCVTRAIWAVSRGMVIGLREALSAEHRQDDVEEAGNGNKGSKE